MIKFTHKNVSDVERRIDEKVLIFQPQLKEGLSS